MVNSVLPADDMSTPNAKEGLQAVGVNSILPKEHNGQFVNLPIVKYFTEVDNVSKTSTEWLCTCLQHGLKRSHPLGVCTEECCCAAPAVNYLPTVSVVISFYYFIVPCGKVQLPNYLGKAQ